MKAVRIAGRIAMSALFVLIVAYVTFDIIQPDLTARFFGFKNYVILSDSMEPALSRGDIIVVTRPNTDTLTAGDVVVLKPDGHPIVAHEIAATGEEGPGTFRSRPHGVESRDAWDYWKLNEDQILGELRLVIPAAGHAILFMRTPTGIITAVLLFALLMVFGRIKSKMEKEEAGEAIDETKREDHPVSLSS